MASRPKILNSGIILKHSPMGSLLGDLIFVNTKHLNFQDSNIQECYLSEDRFSSDMTLTGFIQARMCKIQGLFKHF